MYVVSFPKPPVNLRYRVDDRINVETRDINGVELKSMLFVFITISSDGCDDSYQDANRNIYRVLHAFIY